eukprot:TRINITY_DN14379_c0_g1_i1.p1 TRINITY_DN14379_c0_g1~~TRINITY_DN14379_c0_g1_i1.p1  ORF type:complete len:373 (+),score=58.59 TRINITY_DN14379_c0_g1_i1:48-1166(+)
MFGSALRRCFNPNAAQKNATRRFSQQPLSQHSKTVMLWCFGKGASEYRNWINSYLDEFRQLRPNWDVRVWPGDVGESVSEEAVDKVLEGVQFAVIWSPPVGILKRCPQLKLITMMGAGVEPLNDPELRNSIPSHVPVTRLVDPVAVKRMSHYVLKTALNITYKQDLFMSNQLQKIWDQSVFDNFVDTDKIRVGILGLGTIGTSVADLLTLNGFKVIGWKRTPQLKRASSLPNHQHAFTFGKDTLHQVLNQSQILVSLLPLTEHTKHILNYQTLKQLPKGAHIINISRGPIIVEQDLVRLLDEGHLDSAYLDVFSEEPLPTSSPLWEHKKIKITPHVSGISLASTSVEQIIHGWERVLRGQPLINLVDLNQIY